MELARVVGSTVTALAVASCGVGEGTEVSFEQHPRWRRVVLGEAVE